MARLLPDPTFYPSPRLAIEAPTETLAYVALLSTGENGTKDALGVIDTDPESAEYGTARRPGRLPDGGATSCTTSAGTRAAPTCARTRPTRTWNGAT